MGNAAVKTTKAAKAGPTTKGKSGVDAMAKAREARDRAASKDVFKFSGQVKEGAKKLSPQAQQIVNIVESHKKTGVTREDLVKEMTGVVQTQQPLGRILSYYQKLLIESGYVTLTEATAPAKAAKPAKVEAEPEESEDEGEE